MYTIIKDTNIVMREDGAAIPTDIKNIDYVEFLKWLEAGGVPTQSDSRID